MATDQGATFQEAEEEEEPKPKKGRGCLPWVIILAIIVLGGLLTAPLIGQIILREETPLPGEAMVSDLGLRLLAVPSDQVDRKMPSTANAARGAQSYSAECIICHGQKGKGDGAYGVALILTPPTSRQPAPRPKRMGCSSGRLHTASTSQVCPGSAKTTLRDTTPTTKFGTW